MRRARALKGAPGLKSEHPAHHLRTARPATRLPVIRLPQDQNEVVLVLADRRVRLTNLDKPFWSHPLIRKRDLLQYYAEVASALLPHLQNRALVMKRYPNGAEGDFFYMKRAPMPRPDWIELCSIEHASRNVIDFVIVQDLLSLLWVVNLGCIDLHQWYAPCDDVDRPDYLHFDLDPSPGATFAQVRETAWTVHTALEALHVPNYAKTTGSRGIHVYVPIVRGPMQKQVWQFAKDFAHNLAGAHPALMTAEYRVARRPERHVLLDYNQNAWGRTLAAVYSVRPRPRAPVSTPITWDEIEAGVAIEDFRLDNVPARLRQRGDLWAPLLAEHGRFRLETLL